MVITLQDWNEARHGLQGTQQLAYKQEQNHCVVTKNHYVVTKTLKGML